MGVTLKTRGALSVVVLPSLVVISVSLDCGVGVLVFRPLLFSRPKEAG